MGELVMLNDQKVKAEAVPTSTHVTAPDQRNCCLFLIACKSMAKSALMSCGEMLALSYACSAGDSKEVRRYLTGFPLFVDSRCYLRSCLEIAKNNPCALAALEMGAETRLIV